MKLLFIGDTQRTFFLERLIGREQNDSERELIISAAAEENADAVILLGDLVAIGALRSQWTAFDRLIHPLVAKKTPLYPVYGNHDYFFYISRARAFMNARFPHLKKTSRGRLHFGELAVVSVDSNRHILSQAQWDAQKAWLAKTLKELDEDSKTRGILLVLHHPPYSNSRRIRTSHPVRDDIVPLFLAAKKTLALISGHCHAYERFEIAGKSFIVSGGGGGPRAKILSPGNHRLPDLYSGGETLRPFHYLRMELLPTGPHFSVRGFQKGEANPREIDAFKLSHI